MIINIINFTLIVLIVFLCVLNYLSTISAKIKRRQRNWIAFKTMQNAITLKALYDDWYQVPCQISQRPGIRILGAKIPRRPNYKRLKNLLDSMCNTRRLILKSETYSLNTIGLYQKSQQFTDQYMRRIWYHIGVILDHKPETIGYLSENWNRDIITTRSERCLEFLKKPELKGLEKIFRRMFDDFILFAILPEKSGKDTYFVNGKLPSTLMNIEFMGPRLAQGIQPDYQISLKTDPVDISVLTK